ncbi:MAG TPA: hypothetical protein DCW42_08970 [Bacteroidetes bacterium]|nr:hypothetical protein [Bacteroidota bacterium]
MKKLLAMLMVIPCISYSQWHQKEFLLGAFMNPDLTFVNQTADSASVQQAINAGLNILTYPYYYDYDAFNENGIRWILNICSQIGIKYIGTDSRHLITTGWRSSAISTFDSATAQDVSNFYSSLSLNQKNALYGFEIVDEPAPSVMNASQLNVTHSWVSHFKSFDSDRVAIVDLLPVYAINMGYQGFTSTSAYEDYLDEYLNSSDTNSNPYVAVYNNYLQSHGDIVRYFYNMNILREKAKTRPLWGHIDVNQRTSGFNPDRSYMRFSVNSHLAYGFKGIIYFPYENPDLESLVMNGIPTRKYQWAQEINNYISNVVGPAIMSSKYIGTFHKSDFTNNDNNLIESIPINQKINKNTPYHVDLSHPQSMAGIFYDENSKYMYLYIVNKGFADNFDTINVTVTLSGDKRNKVLTTPTTGTEWAYSIVQADYSDNLTYFMVDNLLPGEGRLFRIIDVEGTAVDNILCNYSVSINPNPFNSTTNIALSIPIDDFVCLEVYDIFGEKVRTLLNEYKSAGTYNIVFDANNFSNGIYMYIMRTSKIAKYGKMLLIK